MIMTTGMIEDEPETHHCDICREIYQGRKAEVDAFVAGTLVVCKLCRNKGLIRSEDGLRAVVCNACPRGYRMKLWLKHQELAGRGWPKEIEVL
jgi:hypothetical protein